MPVAGAVVPPRLGRALRDAVRRARTRGEALASVTLDVGRDVDPAAVARASRRPGEPWFVFENPDRGGAALAAPGRGRGGAGRAGLRAGDGGRRPGSVPARRRAVAVADPRGGGRRARRARGGR